MTRDIVTERSRERSRFLITRRGAKDADVLVLRLPDGQTALLIFGLEEEAGMFLWLETTGEGWHVALVFGANLTRKHYAGADRPRVQDKASGG